MRTFPQLLARGMNGWYAECSNALLALAKADGDPKKVDWRAMTDLPPGWTASYGHEELKDVTVEWAGFVLAGDAERAGLYVEDEEDVQAWEQRPTTLEECWAAVIEACGLDWATVQ